MRSDNPACYTCPKGKNGLHTWRREPDRTATCVCCNKRLTVEQTADCFYDSERRADIDAIACGSYGDDGASGF